MRAGSRCAASCWLMVALVTGAAACEAAPDPVQPDPAAEVLLEHGWHPLSPPGQQFVVIGDRNLPGGALWWQQVADASRQSGMDFSDRFGQPGEIRRYELGESAASVLLVGGDVTGVWIFAYNGCIPGILPISSTLEQVRNCGR